MIDTLIASLGYYYLTLAAGALLWGAAYVVRASLERP